MANLKEKQTSPLYEGGDGDNKFSEEYRDNKHSISPCAHNNLMKLHLLEIQNRPFVSL